MAGSFRYTVWDPWMILSQMATLQCCYYVALGTWVFLWDVMAGQPRSLDHIFKYQVENVSLRSYLMLERYQDLCSLFSPCSSVNPTERCW